MEPEVTQGQADNADPKGTTAPAPDGEQGQSISPDQTTQKGPDVGAQGESFFDPKSIADQPELMKAYKQMQGKFTKSQQAIRENQAKIDAYNAAMADPRGTVRQLAQQYGLSVVEGKPQSVGGDEFNPKNWNDVVSHIRSQIEQDMESQYAPIINEVKSLKQQNIEQYLDNNYQDWRTYENEMIGTLQKHPSMASDPDTLYRLSVPPEVIEARATEKALARLRSGKDAGAVPGANRTTRSTSDKPTGKLSFNEAVAFAKQKLAEKGIRGPVGG